MMTEDELKNAKRVVAVIVTFFLIYVLASWGGYIPDDYNIFQVFEEDAEPILSPGEGYVSGFPTEVNVTEQVNNTYILTFTCNESYVSGMELVITLDDDFVNTTSYWTATTTDWQLSADQLTAEYVGDALTIGVEISDLILHVDDGAVEGDVDIVITADIGDLTPEEVTVAVVI